MEVGKEIRRIRESKGLSQTKVAAGADMSVSGLSQIETGARNPSAVTLTKLAESLGVEVADLFPKALAPQQLELAEQAGQDGREIDQPPTGGETLYNEYEFLGHVFASNWKDELEEWDEKIPTGTFPGLPDFVRLIEWSMGISRTKNLYESVARHDGRSLRAELEDTLKLMEGVERAAIEKVKAAFEPAKTYAEFQKIVKTNDLEAVLSSAEIDD